MDQSDPVEAAKRLLHELEKHDSLKQRQGTDSKPASENTLRDKERWLVINKIDLLEPAALEQIKTRLQSEISSGQPVHCISAATGEGTNVLMQALMRRLDELWQQQLAKEEKAQSSKQSVDEERVEERASDESEP